ncbi:filamentous hemagglutinin N-terminal domain-containing protein [Nostoc sp. FACHB-892]|uniref:two-partner secretion domain-containing protein n=1 Tax=Nostoc sp. FACHB-892 TaxID=2692843 RepID=UPI001683E730|nr:filamentous hemagglutinin N-terminal domain-containing protein [Nostoc sp. FACHB-892]MBD2729725.1 filamentous hemagglutinin N-terminal domain-containing protein [Nostoc sp. FACHB-892]
MSGLGFTCWGALVAIAVSFSTIDYAIAQITPDGTLPNNSSVTREGNTFNITGGTQAGGNLFHSFGEFSVNTGGTAFFNNALDIQNIISRVTGGSVSNIDGLIRANGTANLFLINPNGIIFGENASLNVGGSFAASTANALQFENRGLFSATDKNIPSPLLTVNPSALLFNQINQNAGIQNNSVAPAGRDPAGFDALGLRVPNGKSLLLAGGNVSMDGGRLNAFGGRVELGGLGEPGSVALGVNGENLSLIFTENVTRASVSLTNQTGVFVFGAGGGNIAANAQNIEILGGSVLSAGIAEGLGTPESVAGDITLNATGEIKVAGSDSGIGNEVRLGAKGKGGNITIDSSDFSLRDGIVAALSSGMGNAGNITVGARNAVSLANAVIASAVSPEGVGNSGNIDINAATLSLTDGTVLATSTLGLGNAGSVTVRARDAVTLADNASIFSRVGRGGVGKGGNIDINAATLSLSDGAQLQTLTRGTSPTQPAGQGDAGNVNVNVTGAVNIAGQKNGLNSGIFSSVETGTVGNGGNIAIDSGSFSLQNGAALVASTYGQGNAGSVTVRARDAVSLNNAFIFSTVEPGGVGKGGNIDINAATLSLSDGAGLTTLTRGTSPTQPAGRGDAGNVNVNVTGAVNIAGQKNGLKSGIFSSVQTGTVGNGGNITIDSGSFSLSDGAGLAASTYGQGNAGSVTVRAQDAVSLNNAFIFSTVEAGSVGKGGNIDINAVTLFLTDGAQLQTLTRGTSPTQPAGRGDAGNVNVNVTGAVNIAGEKNGFPSGIFSSVETGTVGNGGNITIDSGSFSLLDGAGLVTSTYGQGNAGNVNVNVTGAVNIAGQKNGLNSGIFSNVETGTIGNGGNIAIDSGSFSLQNGAALVASTYGQGNAGSVTVRARDAVTLADNASIFSRVERGGVGKGGNIDINAATLSLSDGAQLQTLTPGTSPTQAAGRGDAGNVNVNVTGAVNIAGEKNGLKSGIFSSVQTGTVGNGGNITIDSDSFSLLDGALLTAETLGQGNAGTIKVNAATQVNISGKSSNFNSGLFVASQSQMGTAGDIILTSPRVTLDNSGRLNAESASGNGGDINLQTDLLLLRRGAKISTTAGTAQAGGNGGNIIINAPNGFIVAVPSENSDITANALTGSGGRVDIQATGIYGIEFRESTTPLSDITASSEFGTQGTVELNTPDVDPNSGLVQLPTTPVDTQVAQGCYSPDYAQNRFVITGRGGLPMSPTEPLQDTSTLSAWVRLRPKPANAKTTISPQSTAASNIKKVAAAMAIVEASSWVVNRNGNIELVAQVPGVTPHSSWQTPASCSASR